MIYHVVSKENQVSRMQRSYKECWRKRSSGEKGTESNSSPQSMFLHISREAEYHLQRASRLGMQLSNQQMRPNTSASSSTGNFVSHSTSNTQPRKEPDSHSPSPELRRVLGEPPTGKRECFSHQSSQQESTTQQLYGTGRSKRVTHPHQHKSQKLNQHNEPL